MMNRSQKYTISGILTLLTVATTAGISRGGPEGIPAQLTPNINVFRESETMNGVTLEKDAHNIVICPAGTASPIAAQELHQTDYRFWAYEYSGNEPAVLGKFYISWGELLAHPRYASINGLRSFTGGKRYYVMSSVTLQFRCNVGLTKPAECGNGRREGDERCDVVHEGCNQTTCKPNEGYVCENNVCRIYIPVLGGGSASSASSSSQEIVIDPVHTVCQGDACVLRLGPGPNECQTSTDCRNGSSTSSAHSQASSIYDAWHNECRNNACVTVEGVGPNQCSGSIGCASSTSSRVSSQYSSIYDAWHNECRNNACVTVEGAGPNECSGLIGCASSTSSRVSSASSQSSQGRLEASIISVQNANPDADGSAVPTGVSRHVGQFKFTAAPSAPEEERDRAGLDALIFTVNASNVVVSTTDIHLYNKADLIQGHTCRPLYAEGSPYTASSVSGLFLVICEGLRDSSVQVEIDPGASQTFVLDLDVMNPRLNGEHPSRLQVSLEQINLEQVVEFGVENAESRVRWFSFRHGQEAIRNLRFDVPYSFVKSTLYQYEL